MNCSENEIGRYEQGNIFLKCSNKRCASSREGLIHIPNGDEQEYMDHVLMRAREGKDTFCCPCCGEKIKNSNVFSSDPETQTILRSLDSLGFKTSKLLTTIKNNPGKTVLAVVGTITGIGALIAAAKLGKQNIELKKWLDEANRNKSITTLLEGRFHSNDLTGPNMRGTFRHISYNS